MEYYQNRASDVLRSDELARASSNFASVDILPHGGRATTSLLSS